MEKANTVAIIFDDHLLFADSFSALIERLELFNAVHTLNDKRELTHFLIKNSKTKIYLFLDYYLKNENGLMLINEIKRLNRQLMIIMMSSTISPAVITNILNYKPQGFISKSSGFDTILQCLTTISHGQQYICPVISKIVDDTGTKRKIPFTARELGILQYFAQGLSIAHTAEKTYLSKHTIVAHRRKMMSKVHVNSITELLAYARAQELI
ncbi:DNA-binding NarL/FixJ family response regulator [Pedobacter sp. AK013]|uniref:response regulator transcription factor n=1 Tax=Pedobacter sp. AK013 TaxID=2723071 RepID=UPI0016155F21|nr:response regulator transcription factor [Pedobacter sp. AK013]MBB6237314.1 DNA-binding NarL/FixJ family response regulator [Pedobacter sp. AK013]